MGFSPEVLAALCAGFGVVMVAASLAHRRDTAWIGARMATFVDAPAGQEAVFRSNTRRRATAAVWSRFPGWTGLGIEEITLVQADVTMTIRKFLMLQLVSAFFSWVAGFLFCLRTGIDGVVLVILLIACVWVGIRIPRWIVRFKRARRLGKFEQRFPNAIDTIANALEAGMSLPQALESIAREMPHP